MVYDMKSNIKLSSMISMMHTFSRAAAAEQQHSSSREVCVRYSVYSMYSVQYVHSSDGTIP
jgi:hypothetical protein